MSNMYVIRFDNGKRMASIACDNDRDRKNKYDQAMIWAQGSSKRKVIEAADGRNYIKLVGNNIVELTQKEIDELTSNAKTSKKELLGLLDDVDVKNKIKKIKP